MGNGAESFRDLQRHGGRAILLYSGTITASGNSKSDPKNVMPFKEADFCIDCTAKSGTAPTLNLKIEKKFPDPSTKWVELVAFTQLTDVGEECKEETGNIGENIACSWTVGGTNPSFTVAVYAVVKNK